MLLMTYVGYLWLDRMEEDFLFCHSLSTNTSEEIFKSLNDFMTKWGIDWTWCYGVCTDGAAAMTGKKADVLAKLGAVAPPAEFTHRESLAMCADLKIVFDQAIKVVDFIKARSLNCRVLASFVLIWALDMTLCCRTRKCAGYQEERF